MVLEVAIQDPLQPRANDWHGFVPPLVELFPDRGQRRSHTLLGRQSHDLKLSLPVRALDYFGSGDDNHKLCRLYLSIMDRMDVELAEFGDA